MFFSSGHVSRESILPRMQLSLRVRTTLVYCCMHLIAARIFSAAASWFVTTLLGACCIIIIRPLTTLLSFICYFDMNVSQIIMLISYTEYIISYSCFLHGCRLLAVPDSPTTNKKSFRFKKSKSIVSIGTCHRPISYFPIFVEQTQNRGNEMFAGMTNVPLLILRSISIA